MTPFDDRSLVSFLSVRIVKSLPHWLSAQILQPTDNAVPRDIVGKEWKCRSCSTVCRSTGCDLPPGDARFFRIMLPLAELIFVESSNEMNFHCKLNAGRNSEVLFCLVGKYTCSFLFRSNTKGLIDIQCNFLK